MAFDPRPPRPVVEFPKMPKLPKLPVGGLRLLVVAVLAILLLATAFYQVEPEEVGVVTRFGAFVRITQPGLRFRLPFGIERVMKVPVRAQLKEEFGYRTVEAGVSSRFTRAGLEDESLMLTGDLNTVVVEWVVQYRVDDPKLFLFEVRNVRDTFRDMSEAVMRKVVGDRTVNEVLTVGRQAVEDRVGVLLQALCDQYQTGIRVDQVVLQDVNPPDEVKPSFNEVNQAEQERERLVNEAQSQYNKVIPRAEGEALQAIQEAEGYALDRVNRASGEAARFSALYDAYRKAPEVTQRRIYLETMGRYLEGSGAKLVVDDQLEGLLPLLDLTGAGIARPPAAEGDQ